MCEPQADMCLKPPLIGPTAALAIAFRPSCLSRTAARATMHYHSPSLSRKTFPLAFCVRLYGFLYASPAQKSSLLRSVGAYGWSHDRQPCMHARAHVSFQPLVGNCQPKNWCNCSTTDSCGILCLCNAQTSCRSRQANTSSAARWLKFPRHI